MLLCSIGLSAPAATVHRWVDEHGVTHFSDAPPAGTVSDVTTLELSDDFPDASDTRTNYYSIANQWERLRVEREQKTRVELEKARLRAEQAAAVAYSEPAAEPQERRYYPLYFPPATSRGRAYPRPYRDFEHNRGDGHGRSGERRRIDGKLGRGEARTGGRVTTAREPMRLR